MPRKALEFSPDDQVDTVLRETSKTDMRNELIDLLHSFAEGYKRVEDARVENPEGEADTALREKELYMTLMMTHTLSARVDHLTSMSRLDHLKAAVFGR